MSQATATAGALRYCQPLRPARTLADMNARFDYDTGADLVIETCDRLRLARIKAGIEQEEMAEVLGVSASTISNWENGRTVPKAAFVNAWARMTGFNTASLISDSDERLLARTHKREKPADPNNAGQRVSQLPRMDSNHQPCGVPVLTSSFAVNTTNVECEKPQDSVSSREPIPNTLSTPPDAQTVSSKVGISLKKQVKGNKGGCDNA